MPDVLDAAQKEHTRWRLREQRLLDTVSELEDERRRLDEELTRVDQQIVYYASLARDMKKELGTPATTKGMLSSLLTSLRRP